uniref:Uncharacterized protein n=1 Tax=Myoviridae sp. ct3pM2 TaxID=2827658 RepID=A0A8S5TDT6_9CAUD|nr:MAG TPA: hypothetical protein [Myoviridae sp. ct3pM2]
MRYLLLGTINGLWGTSIPITNTLSIHTGNLYSYKACVILSLNVPPKLSANFKLLLGCNLKTSPIFRFFANFNLENFDF